MRGRLRTMGRRRAAMLGGLLAAGALLAVTLLSAPIGAAPAEGDPAPDFALTLFSGEPLRLSDLKGKPVLINFFASW